jgi:hypothetical protein
VVAGSNPALALEVRMGSDDGKDIRRNSVIAGSNPVIRTSTGQSRRVRGNWGSSPHCSTMRSSSITFGVSEHRLTETV